MTSHMIDHGYTPLRGTRLARQSEELNKKN